jgi:hypothetical protein
MRFRRTCAALLGGAIGLLPFAADADSAPPADSTATDATASGVASISSTSAHAGPTGQANASPVSVESIYGQTPAVHTGGSQKGTGKAQGQLADTGTTPIGRITLTPWSAEVAESGNSTSSSADSAILAADLANAVGVDVLTSSSRGRWTEGSSTGASSTDGAVIDASRLSPAATFTVLHAETSSDGKGGAWLLAVGDRRLVTTDDAAGRCKVPAGPVAFSCLSAAGGAGSGGATATGATAAELTASGSGQTYAISVGDVGASSGVGSPNPAFASTPAATAAEEGRANAAPVATPSAERRLARTGEAVGMLVAVAIGCIALGVALLGLWRRLAVA